MKKYSFTVTGMHCASCALLIKEDVSEVSGIQNVTVDSGANKLELETDKETTPEMLMRELNEIIGKNGYKLERA